MSALSSVTVAANRHNNIVYLPSSSSSSVMKLTFLCLFFDVGWRLDGTVSSLTNIWGNLEGGTVDGYSTVF